MTSKSRLFSKILGEGTTGTIPVESLSASVPLGVEGYTTPSDLPVSDNNIGDQAFVSSTGRLYIWTGIGWYNIALINATPTWDSTGEPDQIYELAIDGTATTITLLASDPEGLLISYTATSDSALDAIAGISQNNNQFTITPLFTIDDDSAVSGSGTITFRATDGVNILPAISTFSINFSLKIENSKYTTLMLKSNAVDGATNNTFVDGSTNNFTITRNGNTTQGSFSPYGDRWSNYFDGTGDYISTPTNAITIGTNDFTYEAWIYPTASPGWGQIIGPAYNTTGIVLFYNLGSLNAYGSGTLLVWNGILQLNVWQHVVLTRENGILYLYHNGIKYGTSAVNSYNLTNSQYRIGANLTGSELFTGYISDARIVNGTAVYTSNFTPPTEPLTAVTGTSLLTCQSNRFKDNSVNDFTITPNGDVKVTKFSPYDQKAYDVTTIGGSAYFDGNGDYIQGSDNVAFDFGTGDFTIECWFMRTATPTTTYHGIVAANGSTINGWGLYYTSGNEIMMIGDAQALRTTSGANITNNIWHHVAVVKVSGVLKIYVNGVERYSAADATAYNCTPNNWRIGDDANHANGWMNGYISDLRFVKGTAVYPANFTPPTQPLTTIANTSLLCNFTNAGIYDASTKNVIETVGNAQVDTAVTKFGARSIYFDGVGDRLIVPSDPVFNLGGNFTIEMWINFTNVTSTWEAIISRAYGVAGGWRLYKNDGDNQLSWWSTSTQVVSTTGSTLANNTWSHIAVVRNSGIVTIYIDGINRGSAANSTNYAPGNYALEIGDGVVTSSFPFEGYIDDLRITNGVARYTENFTPPTEPFEG